MALGSEEKFRVDLINRSKQFPDERQVFRLVSNRYDFVLRTDTTRDQSNTLEAEFRTLERLFSYFQKQSKLATVEPIFLSRKCNFFVTGFIDAPTALKSIQNRIEAGKVKQLFRRSALWLGTLHMIQPASHAGFWQGWMLAEIKKAASLNENVLFNEFYLAAFHKLETDTKELRGLSDRSVFSHGDFHGNNILIGKGYTCGLDFSQSKIRLAVYDIVEIVMMDFQIDTPIDQLNSFGLTQQNCNDFSKRMGKPFGLNFLNFALGLGCCRIG